MRLPRPRLFGQPLPDDHDDEIGFTLDEHGLVPEDAQEHHCKHCGEPIQPYLVSPPHARPFSVQEWFHSRELTVHCVLAWHRDIRTALAEETAAPCRTPGCRPHDEHEASQDDGRTR